MNTTTATEWLATLTPEATERTGIATVTTQASGYMRALEAVCRFAHVDPTEVADITDEATRHERRRQIIEWSRRERIAARHLAHLETVRRSEGRSGR